VWTGWRPARGLRQRGACRGGVEQRPRPSRSAVRVPSGAVLVVPALVVSALVVSALVPVSESVSLSSLEPEPMVVVV
jgi:hypothetical protein